MGFARVLKKKLNERYPNNGMNHQILRFGNYLDPRFKGIHLEIAQELTSTKSELENFWTAHEEDSPDENRVQISDEELQLSPTSKLRRDL